MSEPTIASRFAERILVGAVEAIARAGAKAFESLAGDTKKALKNEALKVEMIEEGIKAWRASRLGDDDIPASLQDDAADTKKEEKGT